VGKSILDSAIDASLVGRMNFVVSAARHLLLVKKQARAQDTNRNLSESTSVPRLAVPLSRTWRVGHEQALSIQNSRLVLHRIVSRGSPFRELDSNWNTRELISSEQC
jgi:hypothetical protein